MQFAQTQVRHLGHQISEQGLHLDPGGLQGILNFPKPRNKHQLQNFLELAGYCQNWIPNFSIMAQLLHALLKNQKHNHNIWKDRDNAAFDNLMPNK